MLIRTLGLDSPVPDQSGHAGKAQYVRKFYRQAVSTAAKTNMLLICTTPDLEGNGCTNCLLSCCCSCSEVIQTSKELDFIKMMQDVSSANAAHNGGYKLQENMIAEPQSNPIVEAPNHMPHDDD
jgi:hypothetical protein